MTLLAYFGIILSVAWCNWLRKTLMYSIDDLVADSHYFVYKNKDKIPAPYDCAACGFHNQRGAMYYTSVEGYHTWIKPDDALILRRMKARQERR